MEIRLSLVGKGLGGSSCIRQDLAPGVLRMLRGCLWGVRHCLGWLSQPLRGRGIGLSPHHLGCFLQWDGSCTPSGMAARSLCLSQTWARRPRNTRVSQAASPQLRPLAVHTPSSVLAPIGPRALLVPEASGIQFEQGFFPPSPVRRRIKNLNINQRPLGCCPMIFVNLLQNQKQPDLSTEVPTGPGVLVSLLRACSVGRLGGALGLCSWGVMEGDAAP